MSKIHPSHVHFAVGCLLRFIDSAIINGSLTEEFGKNLQSRCVGLLEDLEQGRLDAKSATFKVNEWINEMNLSFSFKEQQALYPLLSTRSQVEQAKKDVTAFQLFLNQQLRLNKLSLKDEEPLFQDAFIVWRDIGFLCTAQQGLIKLSTLIQEANELLPDKEKYPLPGAEYYL